MTMLDKACAAAWPFLWDTESTDTLSHHEVRARMAAALQAIRTPSEEVMAGATEAARMSYGDQRPYAAIASGIFARTIDAILAEGDKTP